ncbi:MAG: ATP-binding protein [Wenzhouxiangella sp.]
MFRRRLIVSLSLLLLIIFAQSAINGWAFLSISEQIDRQRIAQQMLTATLEFRGDAKRLKVWLAEYIITEKRDVQAREQLFERMLAQLDEIERLAQAWPDPLSVAAEPRFDLAKPANLTLLREQVRSLKTALRTREINRLEDDAERWQALMALFDKFEGADIADLVRDAVDVQQDRALKAETDARKTLALVAWILAGSSLLGLGLFALLSWRLSRRLASRLEPVLEGADRLAEGDFSQPIRLAGRDEFADLGRRINHMASALTEAREQQRQLQDATEDQVRERTAQLSEVVGQLQAAERRQQQFLAEVSHELRTPTTAILGEAELALRQLGRSAEADREAGVDQRQSLERIVAACDQLDARINDLLRLARGQHALVEVELSAVKLIDAWRQIESTLRGQLAQHGMTLNAVPPADLASLSGYLLIDSAKLAMVCRIIAENTGHYRAGSTTASLSLILENDEVCFELADHGIGLDAAERPQLFERHFRGQQARDVRPEGLGVGLAIARSLMSAHDGQIELTDNPPRGTRVRLILPRFEESE